MIRVSRIIVIFILPGYCRSSSICLAMDFAKAEGAQFIVKGVRSVSDFEYEQWQADFNRRIGGIETILLYTEPELASISSSALRELQHFGVDITPYLPKKSL